MSQSTADERDFSNLRHFISRSNGKQVYSPGSREISPYSSCPAGAQYCAQNASRLNTAQITSDMAFAPDKFAQIQNPRAHFATPRERAQLKRRQAIIAKSLA